MGYLHKKTINFSPNRIGASNGGLTEADGDERGSCVPSDATAENIVRRIVVAEDDGEEEEPVEHNRGCGSINVERLYENERNESNGAMSRA